jgi:hypothetical protein
MVSDALAYALALVLVLPQLGSAAFTKPDFLTTFKRYLAFPGSELVCPTTITHSAVINGNNGVQFLLPHAVCLFCLYRV